MALSAARALEFIEKSSVALVYPLKDHEKDLPSLWSYFHPRKKMVWDWSDAASGHQVAELWHFRQELAKSKKAIYGKWYSGRAVFFSQTFFSRFFHLMNAPGSPPLTRNAQKILESLGDRSPLSTKQLKAETELKGKFFEAEFHRATRELWHRMLICGVGEVDDGAFPSLAYASTQLMFEELLRKKPRGNLNDDVEEALKPYPRFYLFFQKLRRQQGARDLVP